MALNLLTGCRWVHGMPSILMRARDRIRLAGWLCLWLIAKHATRMWMASE
jgi:hypothetical protein